MYFRDEVIIIYLIAFFILIGLSFYLGNSNKSANKKLFIIYSVFMMTLGIFASIFLKGIMLNKLTKTVEINSHINNDFILWVNERFDLYFKISYIYLSIIIAVFLFNLYADKNIRNRESSKNFTNLNILSMFILFIGSNIFSFSTINKNFDISFYIVILSLCQIFILHLPLVAKRLYVGNPNVEGTLFDYY